MRTVNPLFKHIARTLFILCEIGLICFAYFSPSITYGHRLYSMKRTLENWSLNSSVSKQDRLHVHLSHTIRRMKEARRLAHDPISSTSFGYLINIARAEGEEGVTQVPLDATIQDSVQSLESAVQEAQSMNSGDVSNPATESIQLTNQEGAAMLDGIAQEVGISSATTMGIVARGMKDFGDLLEKVKDGVSDDQHQEQQPGEEAGLTKSLEEIQADISASRDRMPRVIAELEEKGIDSERSVQIYGKAQELLALADEAFSAQEIGRAETLIHQFNAMLEYADHFVPIDKLVSVDQLINPETTSASSTIEEAPLATFEPVIDENTESLFSAQREVENARKLYRGVKDQIKRFSRELSSEQTQIMESERIRAEKLMQAILLSKRKQEWENAGEQSREILQILTHIQNIFLSNNHVNSRSSQSTSEPLLQNEQPIYDLYQPDQNHHAWTTVTEWWDGHDSELIATSEGFESVIQLTNNEQMDRMPSLQGEWVVWQSQTPNGWEIMALKQGQLLQQITHDTADDVRPMTNGRYVIWQKNGTLGSKIFIAQLLTGVTHMLSSEHMTAEDAKFTDTSVTWREWQETGWHEMSYSLPSPDEPVW